MKNPTFWAFVGWTLFLAVVFYLFSFLTGNKQSTETILILGFAITWAQDRDKERGK